MNTKNSRKNFNGFSSFYSFFIGFLLLVLSVGDVVGQVVINSEAIGTSIPVGWIGKNNITSQAIQQSGYYLLQSSGSNYDSLITPTISSLNGATSLVIECQIATYGSGTNSHLRVDISFDDGATISSSINTLGTPTSSTYINTTATYTGTITSNNVRLKFYDGISGDKSVRLKSVVIKAFFPAEYSVTFNPNGGTGTMPNQSASTPTDLNQNLFTLGGHEFAGWNTASDGSGTSYADEASFPFTADATLYAQWTPTSGSNVTFNANGGTGSMAQQNASSATDLTANAFTRSGYTFTGWNTAADGSGTAYVDEQSYSFASDLTLYAQWSPNNNTLSFDGNGATGGSMASQTVATDAGITLPGNTFTRTGYTFAGWATTAGGIVEYANAVAFTMGATNTTLFAKWTAINYTVTFNGNSSTAGSMSNQTIAAFATANLTTNAFTRTGFTFSGWNTAADGSGTSYADGASYTMGTANVTLYAQWVVFVGPVSKTYKLITNTSELEVGKKYLIVSSASVGSASAMSSQGSNNRSISSVSVVNGTPNQITTTAAGSSSGTESFEFTLGGTTGNWTFFDPLNNGFLFAASSGSNLLRTQTTNDANGNWAITFSGSVANIVAQGSNTRNVLQFNSTLFSCYLSASISSVYLYKEDCSTIPADPSSSFNLGTPTCGSVDINYTGTVPGGEEYFWQTSATGTATTLPVTSAYSATTSGTYHVRAKVGTCWSNGTASQLITVPQPPTISSHPSNTSVVSGNTASFSVSATNASSFQWQVNTGSGWNDVTTGIGATTANYQTDATTTAMNGYLYRVIINGTTPCTPVNSNGLATLTVTSPTVNVISNQSNVYGSSVSISATATGSVSSWSATLPAGLSINSSGVISGTLFESVWGSPFSCSVTAFFTVGGSDTKTFTWTITPKSVTLSGLSGTNKVYDGTTSATLSGTGTLTGIVGADAVTLSGTPTGTFTNKNVGTNKTITVSGYTLSGAQAGNYTLSQPTGLTANITQKSVTVTGATAQDKVYNGTTVASITGATLVGIISPDVVTVSGGGTFATANAGTGIAVTAALSLGGVDAGNYALTQPTGLSANITKANPVFTTSPIAVTVGGTYNLPGANISSTSDGALSYTITAGGNATLAGTTITGAVVGTETLTVNQAASTNYNAGSTTVVVNVTTFNDGDYRSTSSGVWSSAAGNNTATWEKFESGTWISSTYPATNNSANIIYIRHTITLNGTNTTKQIIIENGGILSTNTVTPTFKNLLVKSGAVFNKQSNGIKFDSDGILEVEDEGTFNFTRTNTTAHATNLWAGTERFHPNSNFIVIATDNAEGNGTLITEDLSSISSYGGSIFGNFIIDMQGNGRHPLLPPNINANKLTAGDFIFRNGVDTRSVTTGNYSYVIGGDLIIESTYNQAIVLTTTASTCSVTVAGDFIHNGPTVFRLANNSAANATLTVNGDTQINSGSVDLNLQNGGIGTVNMKGDFTVATGATYTASQSSTATTIFSGGNIQDVSGAGTMNVFYMEVNKTGGRVNLQRNLQAKINLKMIQGHVYTNANLLELGESTTQKGTLTYTSGYVVGKMRRWFAGTNSGTSTGLFPMGVDESGLKNRFSLIEYTTGPGAGGHLTVEFISSPMLSASEIQSFLIPAVNSGGFGYDVTSVEDQGYWKIDNQAGTLTDGAYSISCTGEGFETITDLAQVTLLKRVGAGAWFCPGNHEASSGSTAIPTVRRSGVVGYSNFGFGAPMVVNPLPVELTKFEASCSSDGILVTWETASEKNASHFDLETSIDGETWNRITSVSAVGNSTQTQQYAFNDVVRASIQYYRLAQVDLNGATEMYHPIAAQCEMNTNVLVYPNPVQGQLQLLNLGKNGATISISTTDGRIVYTSSTDQNFVQISTENFESGTYFVHIRLSDGTTVLEKIIKQ